MERKKERAAVEHNADMARHRQRGEESYSERRHNAQSGLRFTPRSKEDTEEERSRCEERDRGAAETATDEAEISTLKERMRLREKSRLMKSSGSPHTADLRAESKIPSPYSGQESMAGGRPGRVHFEGSSVKSGNNSTSNYEDGDYKSPLGVKTPDSEGSRCSARRKAPTSESGDNDWEIPEEVTGVDRAKLEMMASQTRSMEQSAAINGQKLQTAQLSDMRDQQVWIKAAIEDLRGRKELTQGLVRIKGEHSKIPPDPKVVGVEFLELWKLAYRKCKTMS